MLRLLRFDRYLLFSYIKTFLFAISILAIIACVIDYSEKVDDFVKYHAPTQEILFYFLNFIPHIIALLYPLFIFLSTIFFTSKLAYRSEFIAIQSAGVKFNRILRPYIIGAVLIGLVSLVFNHFIVPMANQNIYEFEEKYIRPSETSSDENVHLRIEKNTYVYFQNFNFQTNKSQGFTEEKFNDNNLVRKIFAESIQYNDSTKKWLLRNVVIRKMDGLSESLDTIPELAKNYKIVPNDLEEDIQRKSTLTSPVLYEKTYQQKNRGMENINAYLYELHRRSSDSAAGVLLSIIAVCIASKKVRGGSGFHLAIGILISAFFLLFIQFSKTFTTNADLHPLLAAWIPNISFSFLAFYLYYKKIT